MENTKEVRKLSIGFWTMETGSLISHNRGLTKEQIDDLKTLKEGDRIILFYNSERRDKQPAYNLRISKLKPEIETVKQ